MSVSVASSRPNTQVPSTGIKKACNKFKAVIIHSDVPFWIGNVASLARSVHQLALPYFAKLSRIATPLATTQFTGLLNLPYTVKELVTGAKEMKNEPTHRSEIGLDIISNIGQLGEDIGNIGSALKDLRPLLMPFQWLSKLSIISTAISTVNYVIDGRALYKMHRVKQKAKDKFEINPSRFVEKHARVLDKQCGVDIELLKKVVKPLDYKSEKGQEDIKACQHALKTRIKYKRLGTALNLLATTVGIAVTAIFIVTTAPQWAVAGTALLAFTTVVIISKKVVNYYADHKFKKQLNEIKPTLAPNLAAAT